MLTLIICRSILIHKFIARNLVVNSTVSKIQLKNQTQKKNRRWISPTTHYNSIVTFEQMYTLFFLKKPSSIKSLYFKIQRHFPNKFQKDQFPDMRWSCNSRKEIELNVEAIIYTSGIISSANTLCYSRSRIFSSDDFRSQTAATKQFLS